MFKGKVPEKGSKQWVKNEKIINENPVLKQARDKTEGLDSSRRKYSTTGAGKGSAQRPVNKAAYDDNFDRIFKKGKYAEDSEE